MIDSAFEKDEENMKGAKDAEKTVPSYSGEVLLCEDNIVNRRLITALLSRCGLVVSAAENGCEGVFMAREKMAQGEPFLIIFMDINMPVMDGLEAASLLKEGGSTTPVVALTASPLTDDMEAYSSKGIVGYLPKPFTDYELVDCLNKYLSPAASLPGKDTSAKESLPDTKTQALSDRAIDKEAGLCLSGESFDLYGRLLEDFNKDNKDFMHKLNAALSESDIKSARRMAHTLKGLAGLIGATKLKSAAGAVETELAKETGTDSAYVEELPKDLLDELEASLEEVLAESGRLARKMQKKNESAQSMGNDEAAFFYVAHKKGSKSNNVNNANKGSDESFCVVAPPFDKSEAAVFLDKLEPMIASGDVDCLSQIAKIDALCGVLHMSDCEKLKELIENYEFKLARSAINDMKKALAP